MREDEYPGEYEEVDTEAMVDDYYFTNGADRDYDGTFAQWEKRIFGCDGRTELDGERIQEFVTIIRGTAEEIAMMPRRFALRAVADLRRFVDHLEYEFVAQVRADGWSWRDIGGATGLSHTALHKRFAQYEVPIPKRRG